MQTKKVSFKALLFLAISAGFIHSAAAQMTTDLAELETPEEKPAHQINLQMSSFLGYFAAGANSASSFGLQYKHRNDAKAWRLGVEHVLYQHSVNEWPSSIDGSFIRMHSLTATKRSTRLMIGIERSRPMQFGRFYCGADLGAGYHQVNLYSSTYLIDPDSTQAFERGVDDSRVVGAPMASVKPFIGLELPVWRSIGFNLELKTDMNILTEPSFIVQNDGT